MFKFAVQCIIPNMEPSIVVESAHNIGLEFFLSLFGILAGLVSVIIFLEKRDSIFEKMNQGITFIIYGISFTVIATIWDIFFMYMNSAPRFFEDIHPLFIAIGMIFFIRAAQKFSSGTPLVK